MDNRDKRDLKKTIEELKEQGVSINDEKMEGLGDLVESTLSKFGITQERFKSWFGLKACGCDERKQWLNKILPFGKKESTEEDNK